jgi:hypothetical protein
MSVSVVSTIIENIVSAYGSFIYSTIPETFPTFPADHLLLEGQQQQDLQYLNNGTATEKIDLPNWEDEILRLKVLLILASTIWLILIPYYALIRPYPIQQRRNAVALNNPMPREDCQSKRRRYVYSFIVVPTVTTVSIVGCIVTLLLLIVLLSPYNTYVARRVFHTPILTLEECQRIIDMSHVAARNNLQLFKRRRPDGFTKEEELLINEEPYGWQKLRHESVPTTDLNLVTDPFTYPDQQWVRHLCDVRIAPVLSRLYGIPIRSIQAQDIFVVRYDANSTRHKLKQHTDDGDISFTIYLNSEFTGGGTQFWNRFTNEPFHLLQSNVAGHLSTFNAALEHEGYPTTRGRRIILVGFLNVVQYDEDGVTPTGLSLFASWLNWNWMLPRVAKYLGRYDWKSQSWKVTTKQTLMKLAKLFDRYATHAMTSPLIQQQQLPELIHLLETSFNHTNRAHKARWIEGQQKEKFEEYINDWFNDDDEEEDNEEVGEEEVGSDEL